MAAAEPERAITVALVDDHEMFAESLARILERETDIVVVGQALTMAEGLELVERTAPQVAVVDLHLPDGRGTDLAAAIRERNPEVQVLVLTGSGQNDALLEAIDAGCVGFVTKDRAVVELTAAIRAAAVGESYVDPSVLVGLMGRIQRRSNGIGKDISAREQEVLELLGQGASTAGIAGQLFLSVHTVRNHVQSILTKLGAHSKLEAVAIATREGLLSSP
jgi:DNA-binding NarL/FixJ family response regulator